MENKVIIFKKRRGQTPLEVINELKDKYENLRFLPMTYAGRLDPLAEGVLVILLGDECLKKDEYLKLPKEYELTILFGFATDTYDILGKVTSSEGNRFKRSSDDGNGSRCQTISNRLSSDFVLLTEEKLSNFTGHFNQSYPPYSSRTVNGKPLFVYAREGRLGEIEIPSHDVFVEKIEIVKMDNISGEELLKKIREDIEKVKGDFRQEEILKIWNEKLKEREEERFQTITIRVVSGGGVYMRSIANDIGKNIDIPALALNIKRTKVGDFGITSDMFI